MVLRALNLYVMIKFYFLSYFHVCLFSFFLFSFSQSVMDSFFDVSLNCPEFETFEADYQ